MLGQYFGLIRGLEAKGIAEVGSFHERVCGLVFEELFGNVHVIILSFLLFFGIELDAVFGLL